MVWSSKNFDFNLLKSVSSIFFKFHLFLIPMSYIYVTKNFMGFAAYPHNLFCGVCLTPIIYFMGVFYLIFALNGVSFPVMPTNTQAFHNIDPYDLSLCFYGCTVQSFFHTSPNCEIKTDRMFWIFFDLSQLGMRQQHLGIRCSNTKYQNLTQNLVEFHNVEFEGTVHMWCLPQIALPQSRFYKVVSSDWLCEQGDAHAILRFLFFSIVI